MKIRWQIFSHLFFWITVVALIVFVAHNNAKLGITDLVIFLLYAIIYISLFYLNYLLLLPKFLYKKQYGFYIITAIVAIVFYGFAKYGFAVFIKQYVLPSAKIPKIAFWSNFFSSVFTGLIFLLLSTTLKFTVDWFLNERIQRDLENQRLNAELAFLRSQINPHFLFNSLNSIYSLAYQRSETTPAAILKLSEIMRYMLYECNDNKVDLAKEFKYLENYIDLQKIRFCNKVYIDYKFEGIVGNQQIVPLLLIAFIENAFKHGVANNPLTPIRLLIDLSEDHLYFFIQNKKHNNNRDASGGVGLNNVKRRLNLLYPGKYNLNIKDEKDAYTIELSLIL